ncbi:hypothetical protein [Polyangium sp. y55x31]|uniref:hypothetical protein n=1 Tax=Polyangium sp. y55x31 TaxID=3042688 RepID=UPI00248276DD|nr:hypothetical protein [Polyangium sp. y55x31]MDI1484618.1 hypothetical protein [Polyangium sp. y55x31]
MKRAPETALLLSLMLLAGCSRSLSHHLLDASMSSAHRPAPPVAAASVLSEATSPYQLLGGDMHCHVSPPDSPQHVSRSMEETIELVRAEGLDFVVLTPHVPSQFFQSESQRQRVRGELAALERTVPRGEGEPIFVVGFEYTDRDYGHIGAAFADLDAVFADVSARAALTDPAKFFQAFVQRGGLLVVNHPLLTPVDSIIRIARADLSWRPFTAPGPYPEEIVAADRIVQAFEVYNLAVTELRDRFLLGDSAATLEATFARLDREIPLRARPLVPVGGSDSHSGHLRATTFVLAESRSAKGVRDGIVAGRVCVRDPAACSFEVRAAGGAWLPPGSVIRDATMVEVRARGEEIRFWANGATLTPEEPGHSVFVPVMPGKCSVIRARVDAGYSGPVYVNCPFSLGTGQPS